MRPPKSAPPPIPNDALPPPLPKDVRAAPPPAPPTPAAKPQENPWLVFDGGEGPGKGKHVVLLSGDEEYRSEETMPQLGKILSKHHGFKCTVLFAIDKTTGEINPNVVDAETAADTFKLDTDSRDQLRRLFEQSDEWQYSGAHNGPDTISPENRREVLELIENLK